MTEFVVDTDSCAQLAAYLNRNVLTANPGRPPRFDDEDYGVLVVDCAPRLDDEEGEPEKCAGHCGGTCGERKKENPEAAPRKLTLGERLDNMALMSIVGYNEDEISELMDKLENMSLGRLLEIYPPEVTDDEDEPDPVSDETIEELLDVVLNNDERVEALEGELERYREELAVVRGTMIGFRKGAANNISSLQKEVDDLREALAEFQAS